MPSAIIQSELAERIREIEFIVFDFDGVFTDNTVYVSQDGTESVRCWRGDGIGLRRLEGLGVEDLILSTEENPVVTARSRKLAVPCIQGCKDKRRTLEALAAERQLSLERIAFMGNDINDKGCLEIVGLPIVVQDAHPDVIPLAYWQTTKPGGYGAVREVCDAFVRVRT